MSFKRIAIGSKTEEGKHAFLMRRKIKIKKIEGEALYEKFGGVFFIANPSSRTLYPPLLHSSPCYLFYLTHYIAICDLAFQRWY